MSYREMQNRIDDLNYARDERTQPPAGVPMLDERELPWRFDLCPVCEGKGTHVNPSIDAGGLTAEDFDDDPDFREDYMSGVFDQTCNRCQGKRVVPVIDEDRCSKEDFAEYCEKLGDDAAYEAERLAEIRAGC